MTADRDCEKNNDEERLAKFCKCLEDLYGETHVHCPADTRFPYSCSSLRDHLILVSGLAAVISSDVYKRIPDNASRILFGREGVSEGEAVQVARVCGLLHDIGKPQLRDHAQNSENLARDWLREVGVRDVLVDLIGNAIEHHHDVNPEVGMLVEVLKLADWTSTAERTFPYPPGVFENFFNTHEGLATDFDKGEFLGGLKSDIADPLLNLRNRQGYVLFTSSDQQVKNSALWKKEREFASKIFGGGGGEFEGSLVLVWIEVKGIQRIVYGSPKLRLVRGGTLLVELLEKVAADALASLSVPSAVIFHGGETVLGIAPQLRVPPRFLDHESNSKQSTPDLLTRSRIY
ncbi:MAG: hypothetical protein Kow0069_20840 [Promethearchaeota archaeon]